MFLFAFGSRMPQVRILSLGPKYLVLRNEVFLSIAKAMVYHQLAKRVVSHQSVRTVYHHALACIQNAFAMTICKTKVLMICNTSCWWYTIPYGIDKETNKTKKSGVFTQFFFEHPSQKSTIVSDTFVSKLSCFFFLSKRLWHKAFRCSCPLG